MQEDSAQARSSMVRTQLEGRDISDWRVLDAMAAVPRERFVAPDMLKWAYCDRPLPIGEGQTISQPYVVALMLQLAAIDDGDRVLEVGAGSGYVAALLGHLARRIVALERHPALAVAAAQRVAALGLDHVEIRVGDGSAGLAGSGPFDAIIVSAAAPSLPAALRTQLAPGGRLVLPLGPLGLQVLERHVRRSDDGFDVSRHGSVSFVPLIAQKRLNSGPIRE